MENKYLVLSDIHGNVSAFDAVMADCQREDFAGVVILGDCIDYGMRSNDIIKELVELELAYWNKRVLVNIWGNHEKLIIDKDFGRLSTDRGRAMARYTARQLSRESIDYIQFFMNQEGIQEFEINGLRALAVHGSFNDHYWESISQDNVRGQYEGFDIVLSGHSHHSHCFTKFYPIDAPYLRNKKAVVFINPGSVGQPRNQNPYAQYAVLSLPSKRVELRAVKYDVKYEQSLFPNEIDEFYKIRLTYGV